jgi:hypothetical protein
LDAVKGGEEAGKFEEAAAECSPSWSARDGEVFKCSSPPSAAVKCEPRHECTISHHVGTVRTVDWG